MSVLPACLFVYHVHTLGLELQMVVSYHVGPVQEQHIVLMNKPTPQPLKMLFILIFLVCVCVGGHMCIRVPM